MTKRRLILIALAWLAAVPLAFPGPRLTLWGWLRCEPCYRGRPASYWKWEMTKWDRYIYVFYIPDGKAALNPIQNPIQRWRPRSPLWERVWSREQSDIFGVDSRIVFSELPDFQEVPPPFGQWDPDFIPVVIELLRDSDPEMQIIAAEVLFKHSNCREFDRETERREHYKKAVSSLEAAARSTHQTVRQAARWTLDSLFPQRFLSGYEYPELDDS